MTDEEFAQLLTLGHELRGVEFKSPGKCSDRQLFAKVTRAVLSMANRRDGGSVVIGVDDSDGILSPVGLTDPHLQTWKHDDVADKLATYADPYVQFELEIHSQDRMAYVARRVEEFDEIPVLCKKGYENVLRQGACYVRSRRKPETAEVATQADMRDLITLATEKGVRRFVSQAYAAGTFHLWKDSALKHCTIREPTGRRLEMSTLLDKIRGRGYWRVVIRPSLFITDRIANITAMASMVESTSVRSRGWDYPHVDPASKPLIREDYISQESEWQDHIETWRVYQSGQFVHFRAFVEDWRDQSDFWPAPQGWQPGRELGLGGVLNTFTEIFEFAARWAQTEAGDALIHVEIALRGLRGRALSDDSGFGRFGMLLLAGSYHGIRPAEVIDFPRSKRGYLRNTALAMILVVLDLPLRVMPNNAVF